MMNHVAHYVGLAENAEKNLIEAFGRISKQHAFESDVVEMCEKFAGWSNEHLDSIERLHLLFEKEKDDEAEELSDAVFPKPRMGSFGLLRDLHALSLLVHESQMCWTILLQAARALRNAEMESICLECGAHVKKETMWLETKIKNSAPQVLVVA
jgi:hypothetical protein